MRLIANLDAELRLGGIGFQDGASVREDYCSRASNITLGEEGFRYMYMIKAVANVQLNYHNSHKTILKIPHYAQMDDQGKKTSKLITG